MKAAEIILAGLEADGWKTKNATSLIARHEREARAADAALIRAAKVREPVDEAERYVNRVLEDVAVKIEGGRGA